MTVPCAADDWPTDLKDYWSALVSDPVYSDVFSPADWAELRQAFSREAAVVTAVKPDKRLMGSPGRAVKALRARHGLNRPTKDQRDKLRAARARRSADERDADVREAMRGYIEALCPVGPMRDRLLRQFVETEDN